MQGKLARGNLVFDDGVIEQGAEQAGGFGIGNAPADNATAEDVEDDIEVEIAPFGRVSDDVEIAVVASPVRGP